MTIFGRLRRVAIRRAPGLVDRALVTIFLVLIALAVAPAALATDGRSLLTPEQNAWLDARDRTVTMSHGTYPPYLIPGGKGEVQGFAGDIAALLEERLDITIETIQEPSFTTLLEAAERNELEILPFVERTEERERYLNFTEVVLVSRDHLFVRSSTGGVEDIEDLLDRRIGVVKDYAVGDRLRNRHPGIDLTEVDSELDGLFRLTQGEIDGLVAGFDVVFYLLRTEGVRGIKLVGKVEGVGVDELRFTSCASPPRLRRASCATSSISASPRSATKNSRISDTAGSGSPRAGTPPSGCFSW